MKLEGYYVHGMTDKPAATVHGTGSGEAHYYCVNQRCQFVAHVKPPERKCPLCGSQVWEEGSSVEEFKTKQRPRCFACEGPMPTPASPTVTVTFEVPALADTLARHLHDYFIVHRAFGGERLSESELRAMLLALLRAAERQK